MDRRKFFLGIAGISGGVSLAHVAGLLGRQSPFSQKDRQKWYQDGVLRHAKSASKEMKWWNYADAYHYETISAKKAPEDARITKEKLNAIYKKLIQDGKNYAVDTPHEDGSRKYADIVRIISLQQTAIETPAFHVDGLQNADKMQMLLDWMAEAAAKTLDDRWDSEKSERKLWRVPQLYPETDDIKLAWTGAPRFHSPIDAEFNPDGKLGWFRVVLCNAIEPM